MGRDFDARFAASRRVYDEAGDALGLDLRRLCFDDDARLALTEYSQPAILATEIAMLRGLAEAFGLSAGLFGGHSLGEYTALVAAGVVALPDALRVVRERGRLMQQAVAVGEGRMVAVVAADLDRALVAAALAGLEVAVANDNSPDQVVLSGMAGDVAVAESRLAALLGGTAMRLVGLDVSAPFHSPLMASIEPAFAEVLETSAASWDVTNAASVTSNATGGFHDADAAALVSALVRQISATVRWRDNMQVLAPPQASVIELGPGRPLRGFFKSVGVQTVSITDVRTAERAFASRAAA